MGYSARKAVVSLAWSLLMVAASAGCSQPPEPGVMGEGPDEAKRADAEQCESPPEELYPDDLGWSHVVDAAGLNVITTFCHTMSKVERLGGVYTVEEIVQYPYEFPGKTFIRLRQQKGWGENPVGNVKVRVEGGPGPCGKWRGRNRYNRPKLEVGETAVMLFKRRKDGSYVLEDDLVFKKRSDQRYTIGTADVVGPLTREELRQRVVETYRRVQNGRECPVDGNDGADAGLDVSVPDAGRRDAPVEPWR